MKKYLLPLCFAFTFICMQNANSQHIGIHVGANSSNMAFNLKNPDVPNDTSFSLQSNLGLRVGATYTHQFKFPLLLESGIYFSQRSRKQDLSDNGFTFIDNISMNLIEIPLHVGYQYKNEDFLINVKGGILTGFVLNGHRHGESNTPIPGSTPNTWDDPLKFGGDNQWKSTTLSYDFGVGLGYKKWLLNLNYNKSLGTIYNNTRNPDSKSTTKWSVFNITLGYTLF